MSDPVIVWFRLDLRLNDHPALHAAASSGCPVVCLYIHEDDDDTGAAGRWWLHHALKAMGETLTIRRGKAARVLQDVIVETGARAVYWNRAYEPRAVARDTDIKAALAAQGVEVRSFKGNVLFEPWEIKTGGGTPFRVFTPFYKACLTASGQIARPLPAPKNIAQRPLAGLAVEDLGLLPRIAWDSAFPDSWTPGEQTALTRLHDFIDRDMAAYATGRDIPAIEGTSRLSPHLHFGEISPRTIWHAAGPHAGGAPYLREIIWREFAVHLLYNNPDMPARPLQEKFRNFPWRPDPALLRAWQKGLTGYPIVDAGMRQLWQTGWMHNRVRMIAGSFLVKHLLQPWQDGAAWFWDTLVDADLANNSTGWQWIAGCGADAAPYFRVFNPILQGRKFDPSGAYIRRFVPELANIPDAYIHTPWEAGGAPGYPAPVIDHALGRNRALEAYAKIKNAYGETNSL